MATVYVGSARSDENGKAYGGKAGDQKSGKEVSKQSWYKHSKGWRVFRAKDPEHAALIGKLMEEFCNSNLIGYDQHQRHTLYNDLKKRGFESFVPSKAVETDCSALVRTCLAFCGIDVPEEFRTGNMPKYLLNSGMFVELKGSKYTDQSAYLGAGDILVTKTSGHTVVVLNNGSKYEGAVEEKEYALGERIIRNGDEGPDVKTMQEYLLKLDFDLGKWGADGDFGDATEQAVIAFQRLNDLDDDGEYGPKTHAAMMEQLELFDAEPAPEDARDVVIRGGDCFVRTAPNTDGAKLGVAYDGDRLPYGGVTEGGWHLVAYKNQNAWVSGKYAELV